MPDEYSTRLESTIYAAFGTAVFLAFPPRLA
jgi:hypothetical protein